LLNSLVFYPLAGGTDQSFIDVSTGPPMPYTVPKGYELEVLLIWASLDQPVRMSMDLLSFLAGEYYLVANTIYYESEVKEVSTKDLDPTFTMSILIRFWGTNLGAGVMRGYAKTVCLLRKHGTEVPTDKEVQCKWWGGSIGPTLPSRISTPILPASLLVDYPQSN